ncbi:pyridoxal phosphate-dependent decarboxylase family protein [Halomicrobium mukohataei]|uniref:Pyridoxal-dependent decarboxylase n=2 Tax=Halomicrobium mukohataei TaxID=57705 RepID=C7P526_HALMD|nr:aspartate aminotransferase family protein [Halomicrobium mukohataei]ACV49421.1 Pyridoxal-dependent decarboxylase [Halomicrobium mukohataei DSM 12286]QCD67246.1 aspartate aminotransferase family protein [Halomicrobium mukohataei]
MSGGAPDATERLDQPPVDDAFLGSDEGNRAYAAAADAATRAVVTATDRATPYSGADPDTLRDRFAGRRVLPERGQSVEETLGEVTDEVLSSVVGVFDPDCVAHLQCPPTIPGLAAETLVAGTNQSMDSFDQAPAPSVCEERVVDALCDLLSFPAGADGVFTSGGTQSNLQGLLLAREWYCRERLDCDVQTEGLPADADDLRVVTSEAAHFTAAQATAQLGLGEDAVVEVPTDDGYRMDPDALDATLADLTAAGCRPFALLGTAGTTDHGAVDPLPALADRAAEHDLWFHVDAAYGGALLLSERERSTLDGIDRADSVAVDFHKLFYQPISCGAFLLGDGSQFRLQDRNAAYLNPEADDEAGVPNLVGKSLQTTRRFDALKPYVTFRTLGRERLADWVEYVVDLATAVGDDVRDHPELELVCEPQLSTVLFRYRPDEGDPDEINPAIRDRLLRAGRAVIARTEVGGTATLKFTLLNPRATRSSLRALLESVVEHGTEIERERST